jgi:hypothetical protein
MAVKKYDKEHLLPMDTIIEVVATKGDQVKKVKMSFADWLKLKKAKGWNYQAFQLGFCSMKAT